MKRSNVLIVLFFALFFVVRTHAQTVYITENGKKFHKKNCDLAKTGKKGIELKEAKKQGYEACKSCKPEEATELKKDKEKPKTTK